MLCIVINKATLFHGFFYRRKVRIREYHVCSELGDICAASHRYTDISLLQCWCIIYTIPRLRTYEFSTTIITNSIKGSYHRNNQT